ncbi:MAG: VWA domain-containing protein [Gammaproteobacteria bacterium]|nr:VWA domain-containing protein [Gammaproteobacteria bacterium]
MKKRRSLSPFSLSFLDIMFCGFGAVVLLVLILNTDSHKQRSHSFPDLRAEVMLLEQQILQAEKERVEARNTLSDTEKEQVITRGMSERVIRESDLKSQELATFQEETLATRTHINQLETDLRNLDSENRRLGARIAADQNKGSKTRQFTGEGDRQYLTGLKMGGKRVLILLDASASMLHESVVNVIRLRNMDDQSKRRSRKWQRAQATAEWLVANLDSSSQYQVYLFNTTAKAVISESDGSWLAASDIKTLDRAMQNLKLETPKGGTSLSKAFAAASRLKPQPDNILLITDGLPTQGSVKPSGTTVSATQRLRHFKSAVDGALPKGIPVNTILFPMEGDAYAAVAYWQLAVDTKGSFFTPSRDWP